MFVDDDKKKELKDTTVIKTIIKTRISLCVSLYISVLFVYKIYMYTMLV